MSVRSVPSGTSSTKRKYAKYGSSKYASNPSSTSSRRPWGSTSEHSRRVQARQARFRVVREVQRLNTVTPPSYTCHYRFLGCVMLTDSIREVICPLNLVFPSCCDLSGWRWFFLSKIEGGRVCACGRHTVSYWSTHGSDDSLAGYQATVATTEELTADCCDRQQ